MTEEMKMVEITDAETTVSEIAIPSKITGYLAFYKNFVSGKWDMVTTFVTGQTPHPVLPYYAHETKQDAVKSAMAMRYANIDLIKIVAVEFEV
jgi:hypothetical protein